MKKRLTAILLSGLSASFLLSGCGSGTKTADADIDLGPGAGEFEDALAVDPEDVALGLEREEDPAFAQEDISGITVVEDGEVKYKINYTPRDDRDAFMYWDLVEPYSSTGVINTEELYNLMEALAYVNLTTGSQENLDPSLNPDDFDTYISVNYYEGDDEENQRLETNRTLTLLIGEENDDGYYYCVLEGQEDRPLMISSMVIDAFLTEEPSDLLLKIPFLINYETVSEVDVTYDGRTHTMTNEDGVLSIDGEAVEEDTTYMDLYSDLMQPMLDGEIEVDTELGEDRTPVISLHYIRNVEDSPDYYINIYACDDGRYTVSVNGEEHFYLNSEDVETLEDAIKGGFKGR